MEQYPKVCVESFVTLCVGLAVKEYAALTSIALGAGSSSQNTKITFECSDASTPGWMVGRRSHQARSQVSGDQRQTGCDTYSHDRHHTYHQSLTSCHGHLPIITLKLAKLML
ncbi:hypothetical protein J6590_030310 [Homalodisca vitripennis]|nr:hypothetical protein J6590_030310 [Homalodisca vitripennis]